MENELAVEVDDDDVHRLPFLSGPISFDSRIRPAARWKAGEF